MSRQAAFSQRRVRGRKNPLAPAHKVGVPASGTEAGAKHAVGPLAPGSARPPARCAPAAPAPRAAGSRGPPLLRGRGNPVGAGWAGTRCASACCRILPPPSKESQSPRRLPGSPATPQYLEITRWDFPTTSLRVFSEARTRDHNFVAGRRATGKFLRGKRDPAASL